MSCNPLRAALTEIASSGADVPNATKVTAITNSKKHFEYTSKKIFNESLNEKVNIQFKDYRDIDKKYTNIASIEMFEAVGEEYWDHYFNVMKRSLKPGGRIGFQSIVISDEFFDHYRRQPDFIQCYIFPGGILPSSNSLR